MIFGISTRRVHWYDISTTVIYQSVNTSKSMTSFNQLHLGEHVCRLWNPSAFIQKTYLKITTIWLPWVIIWLLSNGSNGCQAARPPLSSIILLVHMGLLVVPQTDTNEAFFVCGFPLCATSSDGILLLTAMISFFLSFFQNLHDNK